VRTGRAGVVLWLVLGLAPQPAAADRSGPPRAAADDACAVSVRSRAVTDCAGFNADVDRAVAAQERWPREPMQLVLRRLGLGAETPRRLCLDSRSGRGESPDSLAVTALLDGLADDSVAAAWVRLALRRQPDGTWRVAREERAWKCVRGPQAGEYQGSPCP